MASTVADQCPESIQSNNGGDVLLQLNRPAPVDNTDPLDSADGDDEPIECGNIIVPHTPKGNGEP